MLASSYISIIPLLQGGVPPKVYKRSLSWFWGLRFALRGMGFGVGELEGMAKRMEKELEN